MITDKQLFTFTQFVEESFGKEQTKKDMSLHAGMYFGVCPKDAKELVTRCQELEYIETTENGYRIITG